MPRVNRRDRTRFPLGSRQDYDPDGPAAVARFVYLCRLAELHPAVLVELLAIQSEHGPAFEAWAARWWLKDDWCKAHARTTVRFWRAHPDRGAGLYWLDRGDVTGMLVHGSTPRVQPVLKVPEHFDWLVRFQMGATYSSLAPRVVVPDIHGGGVRIDAVTIRTACHRLAALMCLTLRPVSRGRPSVPNTQ